MDYKRFLNTLRNQIWLIIVLMLVGFALAYIFGKTLFVPYYRAESTLHILNQQVNTSEARQLVEQDISLSRLLAEDYSTVAYSRRVTSQVVLMLQASGIPDIDEETLRKAIDVSNKKDTNIITVTADWNDPHIAALISDTESTVLAKTINDLVGGDYADFLDVAKEPELPVISTNRLLMVGILAGLFIGLIAVYLIAIIDDKIYSEEEITAITQLEVIGIIPVNTIK